MRIPAAVLLVGLSFPLIAAPVQFTYTGEIVFVIGDPLVQTAALTTGMPATLQFVFDEIGQLPNTWGEADLQSIRLTAGTFDLQLQAPWGGDGLDDFSGAFSVDQTGQVAQIMAIASDNQLGADVSGAMISGWTIGTFTYPPTPFPGGPVEDLSMVGIEFVYPDNSLATLALNNFGEGPYWVASSVPEADSVWQFGIGLVATSAFAAFRRRRSAEAGWPARWLTPRSAESQPPGWVIGSTGCGCSHAAPRTPLESPYFGGTSFVSTRSENT